MPTEYHGGSGRKCEADTLKDQITHLYDVIEKRDKRISELEATVGDQRALLRDADINLETYRILVNLKIQADIAQQVDCQSRIRKAIGERE